MNALELIVQSALASHGVNNVEITVTFTDSNHMTRTERFQFYQSDFRYHVLRELQKEFVMLNRKDLELLASASVQSQKSVKK